MGNRCAGKDSWSNEKKSNLRANVSKQVMCRWRSLETVRPKLSKSANVNFSENQRLVLSYRRNPPIWHVSPAAQASAAHSPVQYLFGIKGRTGDNAPVHCSNNSKMRREDSEICLRFELGSRILIHMRLSDSRRDWGSAKQETFWCRTAHSSSKSRNASRHNRH